MTNHKKMNKYLKPLSEIPFDKIYVGMRVGDVNEPMGTVVYTKPKDPSKPNKSSHEGIDYNRNYVVIDWDDGNIVTFNHGNMSHIYFYES